MAKTGVSSWGTGVSFGRMEDVFWREDRASWAMRWVLPDPAEAKRKMSELVLVEALMDLF
jgi:hypothetical protein